MPASAPASGRHADRAAALLLLLFGAFVVIQARQLAYWTGAAPGPGFLPFWLGVLLSLAAAALFSRTLTARPSRFIASLPTRPVAVRLAVVVTLTAAAALLMSAIGLVLATASFVAATLVYLRPGRARANGLIALVTAVVVWLLFVRWLGVPVPRGPLGF